MLTNEVKRNIDNARNVLVGKIPNPQSQIDQITTALIYKFMYDIDLESKEQGGKKRFLTGELKKYSWDNYFDDSLSAEDKFSLYDDALRIFATAKRLPELFQQIFKDSSLPYHDSRVLRLFLKEINKFEYDHSEALGNGFEYLLSILGSQGDAGQFRTPRNIIDFMVEVIDPKKNETILDPACGTAGFLISSFKHIKKHNSINFDFKTDLPTFMRKDKKDVHEIEIQENGKYKGRKLTSSQWKKLHENIHGYDISPDMVRLSRVNMYLHHIKQQNIAVYDTLSDIAKWEDDFDIILANPPFMTPKGGIEPHSKFGVQAKRSEVLFVDYIADHIKTKGRGACIVPEGIIFQSANAYKQLRKNLVDGNVLYAVVSLPNGVFQPYSGVKTSILFFNKQIAKIKDEILFVKVENDGFDLGAKRAAINKNDLGEAYYILKEYEKKQISKQSKIYKHINIQKIDKISHAVKKEKISEDGDYNLYGERYKSLESNNQSGWPLVELGDKKYFQIESGGTPSSKIKEYWNGKINWATLVDLPQENLITDLYVTQRNITKSGLVKSSAKLLPPRSILVSSRATIGRIAIAKTETATNQGFKNIVIKNFDNVNERFVAYTLTNLIEEMVSLASGGTFKEISKTNFSKFKIPLPPLDVQEQIVAELQGYQNIIDGAMQVVNSWKPRFKISLDWPMVELGKVAKTQGGFAFKSSDFVESGIQVLKMGNVRMGELDLNNKPAFMPAERLSEFKEYIVSKDDILITMTGTQGKRDFGEVCFIKGNEKYLLNQRVGRFVLKSNKVIRHFIALITSLPIYQDEIFLKASGVRQANISGSKLESIKIPIPSLAEQEFIVSQIEAERAIVEANKNLAVIYQAKIKARIAELWGE